MGVHKLNDPDTGRAVNVEGMHPPVMFRYEPDGQVPKSVLDSLLPGTWCFERRMQRWDWANQGARFHVSND